MNMTNYAIVIFVLLIIVTLLCFAKPLVKIDVMIFLIFLYGLFPYTYQGFAFVGDIKELYLTDLSEKKTTGFLKDRYTSYWNDSDVFQYDTYIENYDEVPYLIVNNEHIESGYINTEGYFSGTYINDSESIGFHVDLKEEKLFDQKSQPLNEDYISCIEEIQHEYYHVIHNVYQNIIVKSIVIMAISLSGFVCMTGYLIKKKMNEKNNESTLEESYERSPRTF